MHRPGHGSPPSATPGAPGPNQTPTQNAKPNPGQARMLPAHPPTPTTPTASSSCTSPAEDTHGARSGSPRPSPECVVYLYLYRYKRDRSYAWGKRGNSSLPTKAAWGTDKFWRHPPCHPLPVIFLFFKKRLRRAASTIASQYQLKASRTVHHSSIS